ncbi:MAG: hypothetical protein QNI87_13140 [Erythrobacter sp.]|uniref:hypothetical protein n=1 Tax=Erythrobacter sp. TaxID=1042 RepID=UPI00260F5CCA|nr:hypothetical protein [Erythrobacter sp.]MDJ0979465.1 hypothetical protein [Erythrobacter sp.]
MSVPVIATSKSALIFAGGVLVCAAIAAASLGSHFTPEPENDYAENRNVADEQTQTEPGAPGNDTAALPLEGFADDSELIDSTNGFDPTPNLDQSVIIDEQPKSFTAPETSEPARETPKPSGLTAARTPAPRGRTRSSRVVQRRERQDTGAVENDAPPNRDRLIQLDPEEKAGGK